jgi:hypothetical protein
MDSVAIYTSNSLYVSIVTHYYHKRAYSCAFNVNVKYTSNPPKPKNKGKEKNISYITAHNCYINKLRLLGVYYYRLCTRKKHAEEISPLSSESIIAS